MSGAAKSAEWTLVDVTPTAGRQTPGTATQMKVIHAASILNR